MARSKPQRGSREGFWTREYGGAPIWFVAVALLAVLGIAAVVLLVRMEQQSPGAYVSNRTPVPYPTTTSEPTPTSSAPLALPGAGASVVFIGDSWTYGQSVDQTGGYVPLVADHFGWVASNFGEQGTGYVKNRGNAGTLYPERVQLLPEETPSLIILQGGLNDEGAGSVAVASAATATLDGIQARYPGVPIVVVGPSTAVWPVTSAMTAVDAGLVRATRDRGGVYYISPQKGGWFNGGNIAQVIGADNHPSAVGYQVFADRLIAELTSLAS